MSVHDNPWHVGTVGVSIGKVLFKPRVHGLEVPVHATLDAKVHLGGHGNVVHETSIPAKVPTRRWKIEQASKKDTDRQTRSE